MKILLVEPSEKIQKIFSQRLALENYEVFMADEGIQASKIVKTVLPEIVVSPMVNVAVSGS